MARYEKQIGTLRSSKTAINSALTDKLSESINVKISGVADEIRRIEAKKDNEYTFNVDLTNYLGSSLPYGAYVNLSVWIDEGDMVGTGGLLKIDEYELEDVSYSYTFQTDSDSIMISVIIVVMDNHSEVVGMTEFIPITDLSLYSEITMSVTGKTTYELIKS